MTKIKRSHEELEFIHSHGLDVKTREMYLHGSLLETEDSGVDYRMAHTFMKNLRILENESSEPIIIYQYNIGGEWSSGMVMYDMIKASKCKFIFVCCGTASSMGSIIPQSILGKGLRVAYPNCDWLIHEGYCGADGTLKRIIAASEYNQYLLAKMLDIYTDAGLTGKIFKGKSKSYIQKYIQEKLNQREDWMFNSFHALELGFIDGIYGHGDFTDMETIKGML